MGRLVWLWPLLLASLLLVGCGGSDGAEQPPAIAYGQDICSRCGMIISEERFAAGLVGADGTQEVFDDAGEMIAFVQEEGLGDRRVWVHDYDSQEWIDGITAVYVVSHDVVTPMASGILAFESRDAAERHVQEYGGNILTWNEVLSTWIMPMGH